MEIYSSKLIGLNSIEQIYQTACGLGEVCIDGGASNGVTSLKMLKNGAKHVHAFEPFVGNWGYLEKRTVNTNKISIHKVALSDKNGESDFFVSNTIKDNDNTLWRDMPGFSSLGRLCNDEIAHGDERYFKVPTVRLDDYIDCEISFCKLDLQGGELAALMGLGDKFYNVQIYLLESMKDWSMIDYVISKEYIILDTGYTGVPKATNTEDLFINPNYIPLSTGKKAIQGELLNLPRSYQGYKAYMDFLFKEKFQAIWTDLIAVRSDVLKKIML
jgi:FkbM family methyltransferase